MNPYQSPLVEDSASTNRPNAGGFIRYRCFTHRFFFSGLTIGSSRDKLRRQAEEFINTHVGAENVVSIAEHISPLGVTVWYREA